MKNLTQFGMSTCAEALALIQQLGANCHTDLTDFTSIGVNGKLTVYCPMTCGVCGVAVGAVQNAKIFAHEMAAVGAAGVLIQAVANASLTAQVQMDLKAPALMMTAALASTLESSSITRT